MFTRAPRISSSSSSALLSRALSSTRPAPKRVQRQLHPSEEPAAGAPGAGPGGGRSLSWAVAQLGSEAPADCWLQHRPSALALIENVRQHPLNRSALYRLELRVKAEEVRSARAQQRRAGLLEKRRQQRRGREKRRAAVARSDNGRPGFGCGGGAAATGAVGAAKAAATAAELGGEEDSGDSLDDPDTWASEDDGEDGEDEAVLNALTGDPTGFKVKQSKLMNQLLS